MKRQFVAAVVALLMVTSPALGAAAPTKANVIKARALFKRASLDYKLSKFDKALSGYEQAYALAPRPSALFNIANCYRHLGKFKKAIFYYKLFVDEWTAKHPGRKVPQLDAARAHVKRLQQQLAARKPAPKPTPTTAPASTPTSRAALPLVPSSGPTTATDKPASAGTPFYKSWWFWTIVGVAVAGGTTAAVLGATSGPDTRVPGGAEFSWSEGQP
jgi:hypothetical protein